MNKHPLENGPILLAGCNYSSRSLFFFFPFFFCKGKKTRKEITGIELIHVISSV